MVDLQVNDVVPGRYSLLATKAIDRYPRFIDLTGAFDTKESMLSLIASYNCCCMGAIGPSLCTIIDSYKGKVYKFYNKQNLGIHDIDLIWQTISN